MRWFGLVLLCCSVCRAAIQLEFLSDFTFKQNTIYEKTLVGGLSGIYYKDNLVWAVTDDRGQNNEPRIYSFKLEVNSDLQMLRNEGLKSENRSDTYPFLKLLPNGLIFLKDPKSIKSAQLLIDAEGIAPFRQGWLISSEGDYHKVPRAPPSLMYFDGNGNLKQIFRWPDKFIPNFTGKLRTGLRSNFAFEALSSSPNADYFFAIHEAPLVQESPRWKNGDPGDVHLLRFKINLESAELIVDKDIIYTIDNYKNENSKIIVSGVSEVLSITNDQVLVLERVSRFDSVNLLQHEAKIYEVNFNFPNEKKLVFDLNNLKKLIKTTKQLDNFEGMALGPILNNQPTLLMVSDDNFVPLENTIWLLFRLKLEKK